jgi:hypothetical protein
VLQSLRRKRYAKHLDLATKFFFGLRFFLENSSAHWFYRATDDSIIRYDKFYPFMRLLNSKYDPLNNAVVIGNCIDMRRFSYLQGGAGIIFSRFAAAKLASERDRFLKELNKPEDVFLQLFLDRMGITLDAATSEFFIGHDIFAPHRLLIWKKELENLPDCPKVSEIWRKKCRTFVSPLNDIVFWHQEGRNETLDQTLMFADMALSLPRSVMWWLNKGRPHLCRGRPLPRGY